MQKYQKEIFNLLNKKVSYKRIAGNTIILYFDGKPGDTHLKSLWINPIWSYGCSNKYVVSSYDFPWHRKRNQTQSNFKRAFNVICKRTDNLLGAKVTHINIRGLNNISIIFDKIKVIESLSISRADENWIYRDLSKNLEIYSFPGRFEVGMYR